MSVPLLSHELCGVLSHWLPAALRVAGLQHSCWLVPVPAAALNHAVFQLTERDSLLGYQEEERGGGRREKGGREGGRGEGEGGREGGRREKGKGGR